MFLTANWLPTFEIIDNGSNRAYIFIEHRCQEINTRERRNENEKEETPDTDRYSGLLVLAALLAATSTFGQEAAQARDPAPKRVKSNCGAFRS